MGYSAEHQNVLVCNHVSELTPKSVIDGCDKVAGLFEVVNTHPRPYPELEILELKRNLLEKH